MNIADAQDRGPVGGDITGILQSMELSQLYRGPGWQAHPPRSGTDFYNYKRYSSIVLLALTDHDYKFTYADVGTHGRCSDSGVWRECSLNKVGTQL